MNEKNPYEAPSTDAEDIRPQLGNPPPDFELVQKFRQQIHALGAFWIIIGLLAVGIVTAGLMMGNGIMRPNSQRPLIAFGVVATLGIAWIALGILTCLKKMWAVYVGLGLSYLSAVLQLLSLNVCGVVILILVILQAHRVIGWATKLKTAGVSLSAK